MQTVQASEIQKNFGEWHDRALKGPIEITKYGRPSAFLISADLFRDLWFSYRKAVPIEALSEEEVGLILQTKMEAEGSYNLSDIPEIEDTPAVRKK